MERLAESTLNNNTRLLAFSCFRRQALWKEGVKIVCHSSRNIYWHIPIFYLSGFPLIDVTGVEPAQAITHHWLKINCSTYWATRLPNLLVICRNLEEEEHLLSCIFLQVNIIKLLYQHRIGEFYLSPIGGNGLQKNEI